MLKAFKRQANQSLKALLTLKLNYPHPNFVLFVNKDGLFLALHKTLFNKHLV
jgi:hypothetical protein